MDPEIILAGLALGSIIGTSIGFLVGAKGRKANIEETNSSAAAQISEAYDRLNEALAERISQLENNNRESVKSITELKECVAELELKVAILELEKEELTHENVRLRKRIKVLEEAEVL